MLAACNEGERIAQTLRSLQENNYVNFEAVAVINRSEDKTDKMIR
ncbi:glycosyltransferase [Aneurinibacillus migulanus]